jgi:hypothetical protein
VSRVTKRELPISSVHTYGRSVAVLHHVPDDTMNVFVKCASGVSLKRVYVITLSRDRSFGVATRYGLDGLGIESRWE